MFQSNSSKHSWRGTGRYGSAMMLMLALLIVVVGMVAFTVDVGLMVLLQAEVQNAVDAGAVAAALELQRRPYDFDAARNAARDFVQLNSVGMTGLVAKDAIEVESGDFDPDTNTFTAGASRPNAVRVRATQDNQPFFFAKLLGHDTFGALAPAIASCRRKMDIMLVLDLSGSMEDEGRIEALRNAAPAFIDIIEDLKDDDHIGVMGLSADPDDYDPEDEGHSGRLYYSGLHPTSDHNVGVLEATLSDDFSYLRDSVLTEDVLEAGKYTRYTGTGAAIGDAAHYLTYGSEARDDTQKVIVLMSDGRANKPNNRGPKYAKTMAEYAADKKVSIYTISLGDDADLDLMQDIADMAHGEHFDATGTGEEELTERLEKAFQDALAAIKRVQIVQ